MDAAGIVQNSSLLWDQPYDIVSQQLLMPDTSASHELVLLAC